MSKVLEVKNLSVSFRTLKGEVQAVRDVSFDIEKGSVTAIVGESEMFYLLPGCADSVESDYDCWKTDYGKNPSS